MSASDNPDDDPAGRSGPSTTRRRSRPLFERFLYRPLIRLVEAIADLCRPIQSGDVNLYLFYVFAAVLIAYLLGALGASPCLPFMAGSRW